MPEQIQRAIHAISDAAGIGIFEVDAGGTLAIRIDGPQIDDRVRKPPGAPHDRDRAVTLAVHLVEPAGLEA